LVVGDESAILAAEGDVADPNWNGVGAEGSGLGVLADAEEVVEGNVAEVGGGTLVGTLVWVVPGLLEEVLGEGDRDG